MSKGQATNRGLGFLSPWGVLGATLAALGLVVWAVLGGPAMFSPGPLNALGKAKPLGGVSTHAELGNDCAACHAAPWSSDTMADRCVVCHREIGDEIKAGKGLHGGLVGPKATATCHGCHTEHNGSAGALTVVDEANFPHDLTGYSLLAHEKMANGTSFTCVDCHPKDLASFDGATCLGCHTSLDAGLMKRHVATFGQQCVPCHDGVDRFGADFDHNKLAFKLAGKHATVACAKCHADVGSLDAFKRTPTDCAACHAEPDFHAGALGPQGGRCGTCHTADGWTPAKFDLAHARFPIDHGGNEGGAAVGACRTCHPTTVSAYTCFGCHAHTPDRVQGQHEGRPIAELTDCVRCHEGGRRGD